MTFDMEFAAYALPLLLQGAVVTIQATFIAMFLATVGGLFIALLRRSSTRIGRALGQAYVEIIRNTPLLVQLFVLFYVFPFIESPLLNGVIALGLNYAAYASEVFRAGINGVPRGQWEAATTIGLSPWQRWRLIVLPQAIPPIIPPLGNVFIMMFKETPLLATIGVVELMGSALMIGSQHYRYFEPLLLVGAIFLVMSIPTAWAVRRLESFIKPSVG